MTASNNRALTLSPENLAGLQRACYLFRCAHNSGLESRVFQRVPATLGLATQSVEAGKLLWKLRPKYHKWLDFKIQTFCHWKTSGLTTLCGTARRCSTLFSLLATVTRMQWGR